MPPAGRGKQALQAGAAVEGAVTRGFLGCDVGLSRSALAQRFVDLLDTPPMQYLAHWRLQLAARGPRAGDRSLAVLAQQVGYESEAAFSRAFKREFGVLPAAWRRARTVRPRRRPCAADGSGPATGPPECAGALRGLTA